MFITTKKGVSWHTGIFPHAIFDQSAKIWNGRVRHFQRLEKMNVTQRHNFFCGTSSTVQAIHLLNFVKIHTLFWKLCDAELCAIL